MQTEITLPYPKDALGDLIRGSFIHAQNQLFSAEDWLHKHAGELTGAINVHGSLDWSLTGKVYPKIHVRFPSYDEAIAFIISLEGSAYIEKEQDNITRWLRVHAKDLNENATLCVWWS